MLWLGDGFADGIYTDYYVFAIGDNTGNASDSISTNNTGTFEAREGDDLFFNYAGKLEWQHRIAASRFSVGTGTINSIFLQIIVPTWSARHGSLGGSGNDIANGWG